MTCLQANAVPLMSTSLEKSLQFAGDLSESWVSAQSRVQIHRFEGVSRAKQIHRFDGVSRAKQIHRFEGVSRAKQIHRFEGETDLSFRGRTTAPLSHPPVRSH